jgi:hypothetical protein
MLQYTTTTTKAKAHGTSTSSKTPSNVTPVHHDKSRPATPPHIPLAHSGVIHVFCLFFNAQINE